MKRIIIRSIISLCLVGGSIMAMPYTAFATGENTSQNTEQSIAEILGETQNPNENNAESASADTAEQLSQQATTESNAPGIITELVNTAIKFASWGRTIIAFIAGKLMSNDWVYGANIGIDKTLWNLRNYMKNIANFILGFHLLFLILKSLFTKESYPIKKELPKYLIASIAINMSWFIMGALVDVANVATVAVGSIPQAIMGENVLQETQTQGLHTSIPEKIYVNNNASTDVCTKEGSFIPTRDLDQVWARFNDMSGPLLFLGASIYRFQSYCVLSQDITSFKNFSIALTIKVIVLFMFIAPIIALVFINIKRIFFLWIWIIFSPIVALIEVLKIKVPLGKQADTFKVSEIIGMIFVPVFVIGGISLVMMLSSAMYYVLGGDPGNVNGDKIISRTYGGATISSSSEYSSFKNVAVGTDITFVGDIFDNIAGYAGGFIGYIIVTLFTTMLLRAIVKMSVSGSKIASSTYDSILKLGESAVKNLPMIPIGGKTLSLGALSNPGGEMEKQIRNWSNNMGAQGKDALDQTFYNSALGKHLQKAYGFSGPIDKSTDMDVGAHLFGKNALTQKAPFIQELKEVVGKNKELTKITPKSTKFLTGIANMVIGNTQMQEHIQTMITSTDPTITIDRTLQPADLINKNTSTGRAFLHYLTEELRSPTPIQKLTTPIPKTIADDAIIFQKP